MPSNLEIASTLDEAKMFIPVGTIVHFFPTGTRQGSEPMAAVVIESHPGNLLVLSVMGRTIKSVTKANVWHVDGQQLKEREHLRAEHGAWDFHPWYMPPALVVMESRERAWKKQAEEAAKNAPPPIKTPEVKAPESKKEEPPVAVDNKPAGSDLQTISVQTEQPAANQSALVPASVPAPAAATEPPPWTIQAKADGAKPVDQSKNKKPVATV